MHRFPHILPPFNSYPRSTTRLQPASQRPLRSRRAVLCGSHSAERNIDGESVLHAKLIPLFFVSGPLGCKRRNWSEASLIGAGFITIKGAWTAQNERRLSWQRRYVLLRLIHFRTLILTRSWRGRRLTETNRLCSNSVRPTVSLELIRKHTIIRCHPLSREKRKFNITHHPHVTG